LGTGVGVDWGGEEGDAATHPTECVFESKNFYILPTKYFKLFS
jgi:hypothetical protein